MNDNVLNLDTQAVLLMCGRFGGERDDPFQPLATREYGELAKWLNLRALRPSDLLTAAGTAQLEALHEVKLERRRIEFLLERGTAMALALERWSRGGIWVISRGDAEFPKRLKRHLKHAAPPLLYGAGKKELLDMGGLAIVGSRDASEASLEFTRELASKCAHEGLGVVSGGARGIDSAAMQGATEAGGYTIGVLANDLLKNSINKQNRLGLQQGRLVLVSSFYPEAGFDPGNAMGRNKYIYALSDRALVVDSALGSGGTWKGALEVLKHHWVPLYVRTPGDGPGNSALVDKGGIPFTYTPGDEEDLLTYLERMAPSSAPLAGQVAAPPQQSFLDAPYPDAKAVEVTTALRPPVAEEPPAHVQKPNPSPAAASLDMYQDFEAKLALALLDGPLTEEQILGQLGLEKSQAKVWLKKAVESGHLEKLSRPVRYSRGPQASLLD